MKIKNQIKYGVHSAGLDEKNRILLVLFGSFNSPISI